MAKKLNVVILGKVFIDWSGGIDLIVYIANAVALNPDFKVYFLLPDNHAGLEMRITDKKQLDQYALSLQDKLQLYKKVKPEMVIDDALADLNSRIKVRFYRNDPKSFLGMLSKIKADVILPTTSSFGPKFPFTWVGYIWDFQHKHFPAYFNKSELKGRDVIFDHTLSDSPALIVNSKAAESDIRKFLPAYKNTKKIFTMPFTPYPSRSWLKDYGQSPLKKYSLNKKPYFIVCNQFWLHKSHDTVIKAMAVFAKDHPGIHLVCTGKMEEPRDPKYIDRLKKMVVDLGLSKRVHFLGLIPKEDQIALLKNSIALIQPTLYEGGPGGGAAYNAVALGVPVISSDIPVNLEMKDNLVTFFKAASPADLNKKMAILAARPKQTKTNQQLLSAGDRRAQELSDTLTRTIHFAIKNYRGSK